MGAREGSLEHLSPRPHARFAVEPRAIRGDEVVFPAGVSWQLARVLRLVPGQVVGVVVEGRELAVRLEHVGVRESRARVLGPVDRFTEPSVRVAILQALLKGDRTDLVVQKATELGASYVFPVVTARTVVRPSGSSGRLCRWEKIAREAAEQSLRTSVPAVFPPQALGEAVGEARRLLPGADLIVLWEEERELGLCDVLPLGQQIILLMGPEGGLTADEVAGVVAAGGRSVSLGTRVLRAETAALAALTLIMASCGEIGRAPGRGGCPAAVPGGCAAAVPEEQRCLS